MTSDLDKLMGKLNKSKVEETPQETEDLLSKEDQDDFDDETEDFDEDDDEDDQDDDVPTPIPAQKIKETPKKAELKVKAPAQNNSVPEKVEQNEDPTNSIEAELGLLRDNGIFRRELLLTLKELVDVQKVHAEILIKLNKELRK